MTAAVVCALLSSQTATAGQESLSLADAIARAATANPSLRAARTAEAIEIAGRAAAGQRPNPEVSVEAARETPHWAFAGTIPLELSGKRQRRIDVANATIASTEAETARIAADLRADVRRAYFVAVAAGRRVAVAEDLVTIATRARDAAREGDRVDQALGQVELGEAGLVEPDQRLAQVLKRIHLALELGLGRAVVLRTTVGREVVAARRAAVCGRHGFLGALL